MRLRMLWEGDLHRADQALAAGIEEIEVRLHGRSAREVYNLTASLLQLAAGTHTEIILNDRVDVALALGVSVVQLGQRSLPPHSVRAYYDGKIGASVHSLAEIEEVASYVDRLTVGHIFATASHPGVEPRGVGLLKVACTLFTGPVYAIGGVRKEHLAVLSDLGVRGVVLRSTFLEARDCYQEVHAWRDFRRG